MTSTANTIKVLSYGGGLDSFAMLIDAINRGELPDVVVFADVADTERKDPGEWPSTYRHIDEVVRPLCEKHGIEFVRLDTESYPIRGEHRSLYSYAMSRRMFFGHMQSLCTISAKVERITRFVDERYADQDVEMWIGFEANEESRATRDPRGPNATIKHKPGTARRRNRWPLIEAGLCRCRCEALVRSAGFPVPRKSACVFCPASSRGDMATLRTELPSVFKMVEAYEENSKLTKSGRKLRFSGQDNWTLRDWTDGKRTDGKTMKPYRPAAKGCEICGAEQRATKATGCTFVDEGERKAKLEAELKALRAENNRLKNIAA